MSSPFVQCNKCEVLLSDIGNQICTNCGNDFGEVKQRSIIPKLIILSLIGSNAIAILTGNKQVFDRIVSKIIHPYILVFALTILPFIAIWQIVRNNNQKVKYATISTLEE